VFLVEIKMFFLRYIFGFLGSVAAGSAGALLVIFFWKIDPPQDPSLNFSIQQVLDKLDNLQKDRLLQAQALESKSIEKPFSLPVEQEIKPVVSQITETSVPKNKSSPIRLVAVSSERAVIRIDGKIYAMGINERGGGIRLLSIDEESGSIITTAGKYSVESE
jgi:hypothetical protein